jgi:hypothetical protein
LPFPEVRQIHRIAAHLSTHPPMFSILGSCAELASPPARNFCRASALPLDKLHEIRGSWPPESLAPALHVASHTKESSMAAATSRSACSSLVRGILLYVVEHPDAKDTLDGINEFWLAGGRIHYGKTKVRDALEFLAATKHWLTKNKAGASVTLYGLNKERLTEINSYLRQGGHCAGGKS